MKANASTSRTPRLRIPRLRFASPSTTRQYSPITTYYLILIPALLLALFGMFMGFSASAVTYIAQGVNPYTPFVKTLLIAALALVAAVVAAAISPKTWERLTPTLFVVSLLLQFALLGFGVAAGGHASWLPIPGTGQVIQPSELLKLTCCLMLGLILSRKATAVTNWKHFAVYALGPTLVVMVACMVGDDMGSLLVFVAMVMGAFWVAGVPGKWFAVMGIAVAAAMIVLVAANPTRVRRVLEFLPWLSAAPDTAAPTQSAHGLWALGSGGLFGLGPGASREKWDYLPEAHTDFILAIIGEEFGLVGTLTVLVLLGLLVWGALRLAGHSQSRFISITSAGIGCWLISQGMINVGMVTGLAPVIGVPFPLVSYGGSAFLFTILGVGVLLSFARSEAGMRRKGRYSPDTAGRDPRRGPAPRRPRGTQVPRQVPTRNSTTSRLEAS